LVKVRSVFIAAVVIALTLVAIPPVSADVRVDRTIVQGLTAPWSIAFLPSGSALVSERDSARILRVTPNGRKSVVGRVRGVAHGGEGGLLGLAIPPGRNPTFLFAYFTSATDNRVVRIAWDGKRLGKQTPIVTGIPKAGYHNGGRLLIGPNNTLFIATGDAGNPTLAQDRRSLAGKVLRVTFTGKPAPGNPWPASRVFSMGHRNVQGLAFDARGRLWASEFGERDVDELNLIRAGGNYGWPKYEGAGGDSAFIDPYVEWRPTSTASPSGMAVVGGNAYIASLRGRVLWKVPLSGDRTPIAQRLGDLGRLRDVVVAPDGALWLMTNNTDGRGTPNPGDDQIIRLRVR
jgi:glucose/arabinose dehydrogenase